MVIAKFHYVLETLRLWAYTIFGWLSSMDYRTNIIQIPLTQAYAFMDCDILLSTFDLPEAYIWTYFYVLDCQ